MLVAQRDHDKPASQAPGVPAAGLRKPVEVEVPRQFRGRGAELGQVPQLVEPRVDQVACQRGMILDMRPALVPIYADPDHDGCAQPDDCRHKRCKAHEDALTVGQGSGGPDRACARFRGSDGVVLLVH